jgi:hypothetical protein
MIEKILGRCKSHHEGLEAKECAGDILIVSHGRESSLAGGAKRLADFSSPLDFTRCFLWVFSRSVLAPNADLLGFDSTRWCQLALTNGRIFVADAGAISVCASFIPLSTWSGATEDLSRWIPAPLVPGKISVGNEPFRRDLKTVTPALPLYDLLVQFSYHRGDVDSLSYSSI